MKIFQTKSMQFQHLRSKKLFQLLYALLWPWCAKEERWTLCPATTASQNRSIDSIQTWLIADLYWVVILIECSVFLWSQPDIFERVTATTVLALSEVLWVPLLQHTEVFVNTDAFIEILGHLTAFRHFSGTSQSVVVDALQEGSLVGQAGELIVGLDALKGTR